MSSKQGNSHEFEAKGYRAHLWDIYGTSCAPTMSSMRTHHRHRKTIYIRDYIRDFRPPDIDFSKIVIFTVTLYLGFEIPDIIPDIKIFVMHMVFTYDPHKLYLGHIWDISGTRYIPDIKIVVLYNVSMNDTHTTSFQLGPFHPLLNQVKQLLGIWRLRGFLSERPPGSATQSCQASNSWSSGFSEVFLSERPPEPRYSIMSSNSWSLGFSIFCSASLSTTVSHPLLILSLLVRASSDFAAI